MGITIVIVSGLVLISVIAVIGDTMSKSKRSSSVEPATVQELRDRIEALEKQALDRDSRIMHLEGDVAFTTKLLEGRSDGRT